MDDAVLPIEVCERVMDECWTSFADDFRHRELLPRRQAWLTSRQALRHCSLLCRAFHPRARRNLFYQLVLTSSHAIDHLLPLMLAKPHLADLVFELHVEQEVEAQDRRAGTPTFLQLLELPAGQPKYMSLVHSPLSRLLRNLRVLALRDICWWSYPPRYHHLMRYHYKHIAVLHLRTTARRAHEAFRLVWTLRDLKELHLHLTGLADEDQHLREHEPPNGPSSMYAQSLQRSWSCASLTDLHLSGTGLVEFLEVFPQGAFGVQVRHLELPIHMRAWGIHRRLVSSILAMEDLRTLTIRIPPEQYTKTNRVDPSAHYARLIYSLLPVWSAQKSSHVRIHWDPAICPDGTYYYSLSRGELLDMLFARGVEKALSRLAPPFHLEIGFVDYIDGGSLNLQHACRIDMFT